MHSTVWIRPEKRRTHARTHTIHQTERTSILTKLCVLARFDVALGLTDHALLTTETHNNWLNWTLNCWTNKKFNSKIVRRQNKYGAALALTLTQKTNDASVVVSVLVWMRQANTVKRACCSVLRRSSASLMVSVDDDDDGSRCIRCEALLISFSSIFARIRFKHSHKRAAACCYYDSGDACGCVHRSGWGSRTHAHSTIELINSAICSEPDALGEYGSCYGRQPIK